MDSVLAQHPAIAAPLLLGATLTSVVDGERVDLRITEVEAYGGLGEDPGSHAFRRCTPRNATMFGSPGTLYVYFTYGMHFCANVVAHGPDDAGAVLVRAGEVVRGLDAARGRRSSSVKDRDLARGPARLTVALGITAEHDGCSLTAARSPVRLKLGDPVPRERIAVSARTGVGGAGASTPWRYYLLDEPTVSPYRAAAPRRRP